MEVGGRRGAPKIGVGVVAGSVWESRMKLDEDKAGIKVFNGEENSEENGDNTNGNATGLKVYQRSRQKQSVIGVSEKRKACKSESSEGSEKSPIQIARRRSELSKSMDSVSADGIKKSPVQTKKKRSEVGKELSVSVDEIEKSPLQKMKARSISLKGSSDSSNGAEKNSIQLRKVKSESSKAFDESNDGNASNSELRKVKSEGNKALNETVSGNENSSSQLMKENSLSIKALDVSGESQNGLGDEIEKNSVELENDKLEATKVVDEARNGFEGCIERIVKSPPSGSDETCKEFGVCEEKVITSNLTNVGQVKPPPQMVAKEDHSDGVDGDEDDWDDGLEEEIEVEVEKKTCDVKEISIEEQTPKETVIEEKKLHQANEKPLATSPIVKKQSPPAPKFHQNKEKQVGISPTLRKQRPPFVSSPRSQPNSARSIPTSASDDFQRIPRTHNKLQSLVDLVMWRDVSRSAFIFGIGTFIIISSSYTKDLNISLISVISYLGLVYLAAIFIFKSIIRRGAVDIDDTNQYYIVGEEDAAWVLNLILPYLNEFLMKLKALFSGDPATTIKLAVLLFILARCGSSITIWKMAKLGFFGVFTVPKVCSSYSTQLTAFGTFWIRRFRDAWDSCSHKKAVAFGIFTLVWNLSSIVARIWAAFMLFVAFRYYQQSMIRQDWMEEEYSTGGEDSWTGQIRAPKQGHGPTIVEIKKEKKKF